jgi:coenzyme F420 hydrogenase subunit beta
MSPKSYWSRFQKQIIQPGNCTHCGACVGLNSNILNFKETPYGPLPFERHPLTDEEDSMLELSWAVCPGRGAPYPEIFEHLNYIPDNWLIGPYRELFTGYTTDQYIRYRCASGGIISTLLIHLLESHIVQGAVVLRQGLNSPEIASPTIATNREQILAAAQSVYAVTPLLTVLPDMQAFRGSLAFVGLPEQVAALRMLQVAGHPAAKKVAFVAGPYTGTNMYSGAVRSFLRSQGVKDETSITSLKWRAGEWPGYLEVATSDGHTFKAKKFYYNYLIPFYISRNSLITPDFTNEITDMSVGDAWSPKFEKIGGGYSVIIVRSEKAQNVLRQLHKTGQVTLEPISFDEVVSMHSHMIDFKKRGSFIRLQSQRRKGLPIPEFGYKPAHIPLSRRLIESIIMLFFAIGCREWSRRIISKVPIEIIGPAFELIRGAWKGFSKNTKRRGLTSCRFVIIRNDSRWHELDLSYEDRFSHNKTFLITKNDQKIL